MHSYEGRFPFRATSREWRWRDQRETIVAMEAIPLIRARYLQAFAEVFEKMGVRSTRVLEDLGIPESVIEDPEGLHPATQLFTFAGRAARLTQRADLGLVAGRTKLEDHGVFGARVSRSLTLHQALGTFCAEALREYSRAHFWIERRGETTWFCREKIDGSPIERQQVELYLVELMLQTIRTVAGHAWRPRELWLQTDGERQLRDVEPLTGLNVRFDSPILAIPIPRKLMIRTLPRGLRDRSHGESSGVVGESPATDFVGSLKQALRIYLSSGYLRIETAAEAAGTSVRTLQRRLSAVGLSYSRVVDEVRLQTTLPLLEDPKTPVTEIAYGVGYSRLSHFTRAFRRWAGVSPSEYRANLLRS